MTDLPSLPTELICQILDYLEPTTELHKYDIPEEQRWDVRHWSRTIAAVARTCRILRTIAEPLLYSRYEAAFHNPVLPFIDRSTVGTPRHQGVRHVVIRGNGDNNDKYTPTPERLSQYRCWAQGSELDSYMLLDTEILTSENPGQIELWRLISQAPNLESLSVIAHKWLGGHVCSHEEPPVWLVPIVSAAQSVRTDFKYSGWFQKLHTLSFDTQGQCCTWIIQVLSLPCLHTLGLGSWGIQPYDDWEVSLVWPESTATSSVQILSLWNTSVPADLIVRIADYCVALKSLRCDRALDNRIGTGMRGRQWCVGILAGLQRHSQTLALLDLDPFDRFNQWHLDNEYARVGGFETLVALDSLEFPWHVLMGSPVGFKNAQGDWEPVGNFQYPNLHDVLPRNLRHLKINKSYRSTPGCVGIEPALCSALHLSDADNDGVLLNEIKFVYIHANYNELLSLNLWRVQDAFQKAGIKFEYKLKLDPENSWWVDSDGAEYKVNKFAEMLAKEGPAGVHMALRTDVVGLTGKVMRLLGLKKVWLDTEEAEEILLGETVDTDAVGDVAL